MGGLPARSPASRAASLRTYLSGSSQRTVDRLGRSASSNGIGSRQGRAGQGSSRPNFPIATFAQFLTDEDAMDGPKIR